MLPSLTRCCSCSRTAPTRSPNCRRNYSWGRNCFSAGCPTATRVHLRLHEPGSQLSQAVHVRRDDFGQGLSLHPGKVAHPVFRARNAEDPVHPLQARAAPEGEPANLRPGGNGREITADAGPQLSIKDISSVTAEPTRGWDETATLQKSCLCEPADQPVKGGRRSTTETETHENLLSGECSAEEWNSAIRTPIALVIPLTHIPLTVPAGFSTQRRKKARAQRQGGPVLCPPPPANPRVLIGHERRARSDAPCLAPCLFAKYANKQGARQGASLRARRSWPIKTRGLAGGGGQGLARPAFGPGLFASLR